MIEAHNTDRMSPDSHKTANQIPIGGVLILGRGHEHPEVAHDELRVVGVS